MQRIGTETKLFVAEDPTTSAEGTVVTADWLNSVQEEVAHVIEGAGLALDSASTVQLLAAIKALAAAPGGVPVLTTDKILEATGPDRRLRQVARRPDHSGHADRDDYR